LSHPLLHPEASVKAIRRYSQQFVDLIDLQDNDLKTLPVHQVISPHYPVLRYLAQLDQCDYLTPLRSMFFEGKPQQLILTFDELFRRTPLADRLTKMLQLLETHYHSPVDTEFTVQVVDPSALRPEIRISLLQCRPQSRLNESEARLPKNLRDNDIIFSTKRMAPQGRVSDIRYVVFVSPEDYYALPTQTARAELGRAVGRLNAALKKETFICVGPGRWGTSNPDLGVRIGYADIYNTRALVELTGKGIGSEPEASFGTHFFQDLVESNIYPLNVNLDDHGTVFNRGFFYKTPNHLSDFIRSDEGLLGALRLIKVEDFRPDYSMTLVMNDDVGKALAFLRKD
jgi:hypothetical protein